MTVLKKSLFFILMILFLYPSITSAEASIEVKVEYGVDNKVQMGKGHPVRIEVINKGEAVKGDFVIFASPAYNMAGSYVIPIELEAGGTKTLELSVKGSTDHYSYAYSGGTNNYVSFYEGGVEKGREVKLSGNVNAKPRYMPDNRVVLGVLSNNHDALNYLKLLKFQSETMELLNINKENIPTESVGLEMYDVLLIHDFPLAALTSAQQTAIKDWVKNGGSLMFDTKVGLSQDMGELQEFMLLNPKSETTISALNEESSFPDVTVFTGEIVYEDTSVITKDGDTPLTLVKTVGTGKTAQVTTSLSSVRWSDWDGVNTWWNSVMQKVSSKTPNHYRPPVMEELSHQLSPIGEAFPGSIVSVPLLIGAFIVYLILLIPVLYFILKKTDKREQAWWIIPAVAILTSVTVFGVGAKDRIAGTQVNEASILFLDNQSETASGYGVATILTNSGGKYKVETESHATLFPVTRGYNDNFEMMKNYAYVNSGEGTEITFNNVEYWSIRSSIGSVNAVPLGKIDYDIFVKEGKVQGTVANHLPYELKDVFILAGRNAQKLGDIKAGETVKVDYELTKGNIAFAVTAPSGGAAVKAFPNFTSYYSYTHSPNKIEKNELEDYKKFQMMDLLVNRKDIFNAADQPLLVGYVSENILGTKVDGKSSRPNSSHLVAMPVTIENEGTGSFSFTEENLAASFSVAENESGSIHHNGLDFGDPYVYVGAGTYYFTYTLPEMIDIDKDEIKELKIKLRTRDGNIEYFLVNQAKKELEALENKASITVEGNLSDYISEQRTIEIAIAVPTNNDRDMQVPGIQIEGELKE